MVIKESGGVRLFPVLEKVFGCVVVERRKPITPEKRAGHPVATLAVEIAEQRLGFSPRKGKKVVPVEGRRWKQGARRGRIEEVEVEGCFTAEKEKPLSCVGRKTKAYRKG